MQANIALRKLEKPKPSIDSVLDTLTGQYDEIKIGNPLYVAARRSCAFGAVLRLKSSYHNPPRFVGECNEIFMR